MSIKNTFALSALAAALALLPGCATTPRQAPSDSAAATAESNEPDLVAQLHERMAAGPIQRQEKTEDRKPSEATADTSRSPTVVADNSKQQAAMSVAGDYAKALGMMSAGKDDDALALLQGVAAKTPQFSGPLVNQAVILIKQQKFADADKLLQAALKVNPRNPYAFNMLGIALRGEGKFADAKAAYESALAIDPNYAKAHFNLGVLADLYMQDLPLALGHYQSYQALQSKPDPAVANWIIDLQKRTGVYKPPPPPPPPAPAPESAAAPADGDKPAEGAAAAPADQPADAKPADATPAPAAADAAAPAADPATPAKPAPAKRTRKKK